MPGLSRTQATEHVTLYCTRRPSALTTRPQWQVMLCNNQKSNYLYHFTPISSIQLAVGKIECLQFRSCDVNQRYRMSVHVGKMSGKRPVTQTNMLLNDHAQCPHRSRRCYECSTIIVGCTYVRQFLRTDTE